MTRHGLTHQQREQRGNQQPTPAEGGQPSQQPPQQPPASTGQQHYYQPAGPQQGGQPAQPTAQSHSQSGMQPQPAVSTQQQQVPFQQPQRQGQQIPQQQQPRGQQPQQRQSLPPVQPQQQVGPSQQPQQRPPQVQQQQPQQPHPAQQQPEAVVRTQQTQQAVPAPAGTRQVEERGQPEQQRLPQREIPGTRAQIREVEDGDDYVHVRIRDPDAFDTIRTPDWAARAAGSVHEGSEVRTGKLKGSDEWSIESVLVQKPVDVETAVQQASRIVQKIEG